MKIEVFCPECAKRGIKKKLLEVDSNARGKIYPWCKVDKHNVEIDLDNLRTNKVPECR